MMWILERMLSATGSGPLQDELFFVSAVPFDIQRGRYVSAELP